MALGSFHEETGLVVEYGPPLSVLATGAPQKSGTLAREVEGYQQVKSVWSYCQSLRFILNGDAVSADDWFSDGPGRDIQIFDGDQERIWRGLINTVTLSKGGLSAVRGPILELINRSSVLFVPILDTSVSPRVTGSRRSTTIADDNDSIDRYGVFETQLTGSEATPTEADQQRDKVLNESAWLRPSEDLGLGNTAGVSVTIDCVGYARMLARYIVTIATTGTRSVRNKIIDALAADPNGLFQTNYALVEENPFLLAREEEGDAYAEAIIKACTGIGNASYHPFGFGIDQDRMARYWDLYARVEKPLYEHSLSDPRLRVRRYGSGREVEYWAVEPGEWVFLSDFVSGEPLAASIDERVRDPRMMLINSVTYSYPDGLSINGERVSTLPQFMAQAGLGGMA